MITMKHQQQQQHGSKTQNKKQPAKKQNMIKGKC